MSIKLFTVSCVVSMEKQICFYSQKLFKKKVCFTGGGDAKTRPLLILPITTEINRHLVERYISAKRIRNIQIDLFFYYKAASP